MPGLGSVPPLREFTKVPINLFFALGFCVYRFTSMEKKKHLQFVFLFIFIFIFAVCIFGMIYCLIIDALETSLEKAAYIIYSSFAGDVIVKYICCLLNKQKMRMILKYLEKYYPKTTQERRDYNLDEHLQRMQKYNKLMTIYQFSVISLFNMTPLSQSIISYYQSEERIFPYELPYPMFYPFSTSNFWGYTFAYITQNMGSYLACCSFLASNLLLMNFVELVNMNFAYLYKIIMEFKPDGTLNDMKKLKEFVIYHDDIIRIAEVIDDTFNMSLFVNYVVTATIICFVGFQLIAGTDFVDLIKFFSLLIVILIHVFFISIFGTEMITSSSNISEAFAQHSWYDGHIRYKRMLTLPIARAQKPVQLHASKFFVISMESFKSLISISYQFFALIKTRYEEN